MDRGDKHGIAAAIKELGIELERDDLDMEARMAYGMFDTRGRVNPFDPQSPIKQMGVSHFPRDLFFVLRVVQLLRGLSTHMGVNDFSSASQWRPFADDALRNAGLLSDPRLWWQDAAFYSSVDR
jgi:hypothetical protein